MRTAQCGFTTCAGNTNPQGIADPPARRGKTTMHVIKNDVSALDAATVEQLLAEPESTWTRKSRNKLLV